MNSADPRPIRSDADKGTKRASLDDEADYIAKHSKPGERPYASGEDRGISEEHVGSGVSDSTEAQVFPTRQSAAKDR